MFFKFTQFWFEFLLTLKIGYVFDLKFKLVDSGFSGLLVSSAFVGSKFVKFRDHLAPQFNI